MWTIKFKRMAVSYLHLTINTFKQRIFKNQIGNKENFVALKIYPNNNSIIWFANFFNQLRLTGSLVKNFVLLIKKIVSFQSVISAEGKISGVRIEMTPLGESYFITARTIPAESIKIFTKYLPNKSTPCPPYFRLVS